MAKKTNLIILGSIMISLLSQGVWASEPHGSIPLFLDQTYDRDLQWEASADKTITPAKVIRWIMGMRGESLSAPSQTEFQPIVKSHNGQSIYVAAIAYKF